jgi:hypothetical protein
MSSDIEQFRKELAELGARIDAKVEELHQQGVLHGAARQQAAEFQIQHARALKAASSDHFTDAGAVNEKLARDAEILRYMFDLWVAQIDRASERRPPSQKP